MSKINDKIMAFVGTDNVKEIIDELSDHTDNIYAVVSEEYGVTEYPGGNITVISRHLDEEDIRKWVKNSGITIIIDGTAVNAVHERELIKRVAESEKIEYLRIVEYIQIDQRIHIGRSSEDIIRSIEYSHGNVLVKGDKKLLHELTAWDRYGDKIYPLISPDSVFLQEFADAGYDISHVICLGKKLSAEFLLALISEYTITQILIMGYDSVSMPDILQAAELSHCSVTICGEIVQEEGYSTNEAWNFLKNKYGL